MFNSLSEKNESCIAALGDVFFFQAEDGIRGCLLSRGLGDSQPRDCFHADAGDGNHDGHWLFRLGVADADRCLGMSGSSPLNCGG